MNRRNIQNPGNSYPFSTSRSGLSLTMEPLTKRRLAPVYSVPFEPKLVQHPKLHLPEHSSAAPAMHLIRESLRVGYA